MGSMRERVAAGLVAAGLVAVGVGVLGAPAHAIVPKTTDCAAHLIAPADPEITLSASPAPGSDIPAGTALDVTTEWTPANWHEMDRILVCTSSDGYYSSTLSGGQRPLENTGAFTWSIHVPRDTPVGTDLCVRGTIYGQSAARVQQKPVSEAICFRTAAAPATTTTTSAAPTTTTTTTAPPPAEEEPADPATVPAGEPKPTADVVKGEVVVAPAPLPLAELPRTGSGVNALLILGGAALALGGVAILLGRRSPSGSRA